MNRTAVGSSRPSTPYVLFSNKDVHARVKPGQDDFLE